MVPDLLRSSSTRCTLACVIVSLQLIHVCNHSNAADADRQEPFQTTMSRHNATTSRCYAMLRYDDAMLHYATTLRQATQLCYAVLCYAMLCHNPLG